MKIGVITGSAGLFAGEPNSTLTPQPLTTTTPWGPAASPIYRWTPHQGGVDLMLLSRHGPDHEFAPHQINYRANVWLFRELGVECVIGTYTVGSRGSATSCWRSCRT